MNTLLWRKQGTCLGTSFGTSWLLISGYSRAAPTFTVQSAKDFKSAIEKAQNDEVNKIVSRLIQAQYKAVQERRPSFEIELNSHPSEQMLYQIRNTFPEPGWHVEVFCRNDRNEINIILKISLAEVAHKHSGA